jgi:hypothetical protein
MYSNAWGGGSHEGRVHAQESLPHGQLTPASVVGDRANSIKYWMWWYEGMLKKETLVPVRLIDKKYSR